MVKVPEPNHAHVVLEEDTGLFTERWYRFQALVYRATGGGTGVERIIGDGTPEGAVVANKGSTFQRRDGGAGTSFYIKESGDGTNSGWVAK